MKKHSIWTVTLAVATGLSTGAWAQHGAGVHGGHDSDIATNSGPHSPSSHGSGAPNFESRIANDPALWARIKPMLPAGETLQQAASGFKSQGQFIATLHASRNLKVPFDQLKADMTGSEHDSLGQAIHDVRPDLSSKNVKNNVKLAQNQTKTDLEEAAEKDESAGK